jgi:hypothetical protein
MKRHLLRSLIRACVDDERTLQHERRFVDMGRSGTLARLARERRQFVVELEHLAQPGQAGSGGSWGELLREAGRSLRVVATGPNSGDAVTACQQSRSRTEACYDRALQGSWPVESREILEAQQGILHAEATELSRLSFGL